MRATGTVILLANAFSSLFSTVLVHLASPLYFSFYLYSDSRIHAGISSKSVILAFDTALVGNSVYQIFFSVEKYQKTGHHVDRSHGECQSDLSGIDLA